MPQAKPKDKPKENVVLIEANGLRVKNPDDPTLPWKMECIFGPPEFMTVAFIALYGATEFFIFRANTKEDLEECVKKNGFDEHPRLIRIVYSQPENPAFTPIEFKPKRYMT